MRIKLGSDKYARQRLPAHIYAFPVQQIVLQGLQKTSTDRGHVSPTLPNSGGLVLLFENDARQGWREKAGKKRRWGIQAIETTIYERLSVDRESSECRVSKISGQYPSKASQYRA